MNISKIAFAVALIMSTVGCKGTSSSSADQPNKKAPGCNTGGNHGGSGTKPGGNHGGSGTNPGGNHGGSGTNPGANTGNEWVTAHNALRRRHGVGDLKWSKTIAKSAQAYANTCPKGHSRSKYGENLAWSSYNRSPTSVVNYLYSEESDYNYSKPGFGMNTGHFTQIVWKSTTQVGCGYKNNCTNGYSHVVVCQYNPAGNMMGRFPQNVLPKR